MEIEMKPVASSAIAAVGYDSGTKTLRVRMHGSTNAAGKEYDYPGVDQHDAHSFINTPVNGSHGQHLSRHIKPKYGIAAQKAKA